MRTSNEARTERARRLRQASSRAEQQLWRALRGRRLAGFKIVRQEPIGPFFADFACRERKLVIEVDGATHSTDAEQALDEQRSAYLRRVGYRILRFQNNDVYENPEGVVEAIAEALEKAQNL